MNVVRQVDDIALWITAVVAGLTAIGAAARWVYRRTCRAVKWAQDVAEKLDQVGELAASADYHSRPNGGGSAYDHLLAEVRDVGQRVDAHGHRLDEHISQAASIHDEQAAALTYLAEALPIVARSAPHPLDAPPETGPNPAA